MNREKEREMYMIESKGGAITCVLLALLFLGTWPAIMTLTERRGRLPQHTYLDYTITLGQIGPSRPNFITQLSQDNWQSVMFAMAGGIVLNLGNFCCYKRPMAHFEHGVPKLNVYTAFFYFSVSAFVLALILNIRFLYWPILGLPRSSFKAYLNDWNGRGWSFLAEFLCGFGNGLQFMGGQAAGYAAADAVQALPLVSTFWGI
ncbi:unnamed protein product [Thlaspi arvense]|uniref:Uncharacterized protein n=1 Tax=Thlaspi arvense TaxID=13288 RepID=A0AAU9RLY2_THLAR|nr:unnamed protein product [Thlaspi arvense]